MQMAKFYENAVSLFYSDMSNHPSLTISNGAKSHTPTIGTYSNGTAATSAKFLA
jgi:hypothetical protein